MTVAKGLPTLSTGYSQKVSDIMATLLHKDMDQLRRDMEQMEMRLNARMDAQRENLRREISDSKAELVHWVVGVGLLQISLITALLVKLLPG